MEKEILLEIKSLHKLVVRKIIADGNSKQRDFMINPPTPTQMQIMDYLIKHEEVYQKDLEKVLNLRRATVSGVLHTMEKNNLITRVVSSSDTRVKKVLLNDNAKEFFDMNKKKLDEIKEVAIKDISPSELEECMKTITKMKENLKNSLKG